MTCLLTVKEAGKQYAAIGERHFRRLIAERKIAVHRVGGKVLLAVADIEAFIAAGREEPLSVRTKKNAPVAAGAFGAITGEHLLVGEVRDAG